MELMRLDDVMRPTELVTGPADDEITWQVVVTAAAEDLLRGAVQWVVEGEEEERKATLKIDRRGLRKGLLLSIVDWEGVTDDGKPVAWAPKLWMHIPAEHREQLIVQFIRYGMEGKFPSPPSPATEEILTPVEIETTMETTEE